MQERHTVGDRELDLLRWLEEAGGATVGEAAERYGVERGLARSTVLTMMERLRGKRLLRRREVDGVYRYAVAVPASELARRAVQQFVDDTLGGSLTPFVSYLAERESIDAAQMAELEALLASLRDRRGGQSS
ncbi:MAG: BlaI/MecI/CopY family transcriptional regulator [Thermoanaerobaculia bacterium]|nr:BlaI/MecI/CopY family transcriptional regulator [Thermoanaerobaculia bacterium]